jgi:hypothetical protein
MILRTTTKCPNCGKERELVLTPTDTESRGGNKIICCGYEDGGCEACWYVVSWSVELKTETYLIAEKPYSEAQT